MSRCFDLARRGIGHVSPNPPVGAVLVYQDRILGEGYHQKFGGPHAEVNAISSVRDEDRHLIPESTLYVSLEPCCTVGKTGACTELIKAEGIKDVRISAFDPNNSVPHLGVAHLQSAGVQITTKILENQGKSLIRPFSTNILLKRPHIQLKWAQSKHNISGVEGQQVWFSDPTSSAWTHKLRAEADAILVGARTVTTDNPQLTTRHYPGKSPQRVVYDPNGRLSDQYDVFKDDGCQVHYYALAENEKIRGQHIRKSIISTPNALAEIIEDLFREQIGIVLVEGGPYVHKLFIKEALWDEAWVIRTQHEQTEGILAPNVNGGLIQKIEPGVDTIIGIQNTKTER